MCDLMLSILSIHFSFVDTIGACMPAHALRYSHKRKESSPGKEQGEIKVFSSCTFIHFGVSRTFPSFFSASKYMYRSILPHSNVLRKYFMPQRPKSSQRTKGPFTLWDTKDEHDIVFRIAFLFSTFCFLFKIATKSSFLVHLIQW